ncbi:peptidase domain-containing ABC transporter [Paludibacterium paludis]|uniref:Cyclolysin secretion/processing ATP-binding protein CyaB n=1 Tax=Paludibacterium paludis TaxID=1225769 RepID=A0A918UAY5_9NEIS|nr:peptidase domain-containing ABC transporter [Paludibacterium paludis]GGY19550.1 colicin V biosynthesis protein [Paludibacterium paludis]
MTVHQATPLLQFWRRRHLPVRLQTEAAECGLACLAMIASYWEYRSDVASLRRRFSLSLKGATLKNLIAMATGLGLTVRPLKLDMEHLPQLALPCVLHWDMTHFVVLKAVNTRYAVIHDPAVGARRLRLAELARHFTGVALELMPGEAFRPQETRQLFTPRSLMGRVDGLGYGLGQILLLGLALQVCALTMPFYLQWIVDEALVAADRDLITVLGLGFLLLAAIQAMIGAVRSWVTITLSTDLNFQWLGNAFRHLLRLPLPWFEKRHLGDIVSRFGSIQTIQQKLTSHFVEGIIDGVLVLATLGAMLLYSIPLAGVSLLVVGLYGALRGVAFRALREATAEQIIHAARQQSHFLESTRGVQSVRLFSRQHERHIGWMNLMAEQFNAELRIARLSISFQTANTLLFGLERITVIWLAALAVMEQRFSVGMLFAFLSYKDQFSQRMAALIDRLFELSMMRLHGERVADIVLTTPEADEPTGETDLAGLTPSLELRQVAFRYSDNEPYVLNGLNLTVPAGQCVALTGPSGCGKTTLVKLLLGLLEPTDGEILVGGIRLAHLGVDNYRKMLGTVMQDDQLFSGSIADNISFFDSHPDQDRIEQCAALAAVHDEITTMPMSYNTLVGDIGSGLSGGQKQRILLTRALYREPRILMLDEATSHLDIENERRVNAAVAQIAMTRLLVAHRPETIATAERVVVLDDGRIVQDVITRPSKAPPNEIVEACQVAANAT